MSVNAASGRLTFLKSDGCKIVKQQGRVTLVVTKEHNCYSIWVDRFIVSYCGEKESMKWFTDWVKKVESGEYDESEHGKRRAKLAREQAPSVGARLDSGGIDTRIFELAFGTETAGLIIWLWFS